jgi:hypothetical protein
MMLSDREQRRGNTWITFGKNGIISGMDLGRRVLCRGWCEKIDRPEFPPVSFELLIFRP